MKNEGEHTVPNAEAQEAHTTAEQAQEATADTQADTQATDVEAQEVQETPETPAEPAAKTFDEDYVKKLREENAANRVKAKEAAQRVEDILETVRKALGEGGEEESVEDQLARITKERDTYAEQLRQHQAEATLNSLIAKHGGTPELLTPYLKGIGALEALDPTSEDYAAQVEAIVTETLTEKPVFRAQAAPKTSGQPEQKNPTPAPITREDLEGMTSEEIMKAHREGKLNHLLKS